MPVDISFDYLAIGLILYIVGSVVQYQSHASMAQQRKRVRSDGNNGEHVNLFGLCVQLCSLLNDS